MKKLLTLALVFFLFTSNYFASGFQINEQGSRAMAMGGAFAGLANDASAMYFNPAGITQLTGTHFLGGVTLISPSSTFRGPSPSIEESKLKPHIFNPIHLSITHQINDKLHLGFSVGNNYGLGTTWEDDWVGRFMAVETEIRTFFMTGVASYKVSDVLSLGFGYVFAYGDVLIGKKANLSPFNAEAYLELNGTGSGSGFTGGILLTPTDAIQIGLSYRSRVRIDFNGDATPSDAPSQYDGLLPNGEIDAALITPANITLGVAIKPLKNLTFVADYQYVGWDSYDKLEVKFADYTFRDGSKSTTSIRDFENGFIARAGVEYGLSESLDLRAGIFYDKNPVKDERLDPTLPDSDRLGFNGGFGYSLTESISFDLAYMFLRFDERTITNSHESYSGLSNSIAPMNGVYNSTAHLLSLTFSYKL
ncbi:MAG: outer membrane protein transport protein [Melioribacteraceae bacterium]